MTVREPEYTPREVALLLASKRRDGELNAYGIPYAEAMDPANQFAYDAQKSPTVDWAEKALKDASDWFYKSNPDANRNGHRWGKVKRRT